MVLIISSVFLLLGIISMLSAHVNDYSTWRGVGLVLIIFSISIGFFLCGMTVPVSEKTIQYPREQVEVVKTKQFVLVNVGDKNYFVRDIYSYTQADSAKNIYMLVKYNSYGIEIGTSVCIYPPK